tara:strand:- start:1227 stop:2213 length:987 start_codon:yes stop_codon:yes gene_type:complete
MIFLVMVRHKHTGVNFWKPFFNDLKPFDTLDIEDVIKRNKDTISSFDKCEELEKKGHYFLRITKDQLTDPRVKKLHDKFNHKNTNIKDLQIIKFEAYGERVFTQDYDKNYIKPKSKNNQFVPDQPNFQLRDGKVSPGFGTWDWKDYFYRVDIGETARENIYLEIPYKIIEDNLALLEGTDMSIIKRFIREIEDTNEAWNNIEYVNEVIKEYDTIWKDWNYQFPILSYISVKRDGLLFPILAGYSSNSLPGNGMHRFSMTALSKSDIPIILPKSKESRYYIRSKFKDYRKLDNEYTYLLLDVDTVKKVITFYLSSEDTIKECLGKYELF